MKKVEDEKPIAGIATSDGLHRVSGSSVLAVLGIWIATSSALGPASYYGLQALRANGWEIPDPTVAIVAEVYAILILAHFVVFGGARSLGVRLRFRWTSLKDAGLGVLVWAGSLAVTLIVYLAAMPFTGPILDAVRKTLYRATDVARLPEASWVTLSLIGLRIFVLVPIAEEMFFRGALYGWIRSRFTFASTALMTSAIFGVAHIFPAIMPVAFVFGLGACWVRERTGSSFSFVIAHAVNSMMFLAAAILLKA
jgi:membrane protease YdiL (CAAX protease family)